MPENRELGAVQQEQIVLKSFAALENPIVSEFVRCKMREDMPVVPAIFP